jgi:hypothetical protein
MKDLTMISTNEATYVAVTATTVAMPSSNDGTHAAGQLIGIGILVAERDARGRWRFARRAHALADGDPVDPLLDWAAHRLPADATLIGWDVDHTLMPMLLGAVESATPGSACRFLERLARLTRGGIVDMALDHGGAGAPPLAIVAAECAIYSPAWQPDATVAAWASGRLDPARRDLADEALAIWRLFVRLAGVAGIDAEAAIDAWIARHKTLRVIDRANDAA